jgi:hypothetical protein
VAVETAALIGQGYLYAGSPREIIRAPELVLQRTPRNCQKIQPSFLVERHPLDTQMSPVNDYLPA